jgi:hypothetical protein
MRELPAGVQLEPVISGAPRRRHLTGALNDKRTDASILQADRHRNPSWSRPDDDNVAHDPSQRLRR